MKITDFALVFIGITLPIIIIVYVNVSFTIKAKEQEMYYKKIISAAVEDATNQMKEVENTDAEVDYGYSGLQNSKVSVNPEIAKNTFLSSLYNNFGIKGNKGAEQYLQTFIPCIAILDYNGVYISSMEEYEKDGTSNIEHIVKPKRYYSYTYTIKNDNSIVDGIDTSNTSNTNNVIHTVEFTMDDYIYHRSSGFDGEVKSFYISDSENNSVLAPNDIIDDVVKLLQSKRKQVIIDTITKEISNAVNKATSYANAAGIEYNFVFPTITQDDMNNAIQNIGMFAFVQGINIGNKYLNAKSYSTTKLEEVNKYYFSLPTGVGEISTNTSKFKYNLYHKDINCPEYRISNYNGKMGADGKIFVITPSYVTTKQQAASASVAYKKDKDDMGEEDDKNYGWISAEGFYPCPICKP